MHKNLTTALNVGGQRTITKWKKRYGDATHVFVAAHAEDGTIIQPDKLLGTPSPTELKAAATAGKRKTTDISKTAESSKQIEPNTAAAKPPSAGRSAGNGDAKDARGEKRKATNVANPAEPLKRMKLMEANTAAATSRSSRRSAGSGDPKAASCQKRKATNGANPAKQLKPTKPMKSNTAAAGPPPAGRSAESGGTKAARGEKRKRERDDEIDNLAKKQKAMRQLKGLLNHKVACFSNAAIQVFDAAIEGHDVDSLLGAVTKTDGFGLTPEELKLFNKNQLKGLKSVLKKRNDLRAAVRQAANAGEHDKVSATKHLRSLLYELHLQHQDGNKEVSPFIFQTVLAWGCAEDAKRPEKELSPRQTLSGDTQEDCFEYFQTLLDVLCSEPSAHNADGINSLFSVETELRDVCSDKCGYESDARPATSNYHSITVPSATAELQHVALGKLIDRSQRSCTDRHCACNAPLLQTTTFVKAPESIVIKVDRAKYDKKKGLQKTMVGVDLFESASLEIKGKEYKVAAVVMHQGRSVGAGHYTVFRKHGEQWYLINDEDVGKRSEEMIKDSKGNG